MCNVRKGAAVSGGSSVALGQVQGEYVYGFAYGMAQKTAIDASAVSLSGVSALGGLASVCGLAWQAAGEVRISGSSIALENVQKSYVWGLAGTMKQ